MNVEKTTEAMSQKKEEVKQPMMGKMEQKMGKTEAKDSDLGVEKEKLSGEHKEGGVQYKKSETEQKGTFQTDLDKEVKKEEDEVKTKDNTKTELLGITVTQEDLKLKDWTCLLKIHNDKLSKEQIHFLGNMFVEFANFKSVDDLKKNGLPKWPLKEMWFEIGHVPLQEKRTFGFRALIDLYVHYIKKCDLFKDFVGEIGIIDFVDLTSSVEAVPIRIN